MTKEPKERAIIARIRKAVANYMFTEGCSCCRNYEGHKHNKEVLGKLLNVPRYQDHSGYNFDRFVSRKK